MPAIAAIDNTWGAVLIGSWLALLYGVLTLQIYVYNQNYPKDTRFLKSTVAVIWILDTFHTVLIYHKMYTYLITNFGDYDALAHNTWSFNMHVLVTTLVASISQTFFMQRCWRFDKSPVNLALMVVILALALVQLAFGLGLTFSLTEYVQFLNYTVFYEPGIWAVDTWLASAAACDHMVSAAFLRLVVLKRSTIKRT
ncbi:hypothetical protein CALVIDRAFT_568312 [Calocera viscosa TUFC12733]|uniref:Uncharacterized protein n=1 Tax=Calocera viscosa (strain TUFC12733) TaxID=1330018 RepID=A0A167HA07_CALVF|nr:hypothetical protein CALVIDRAFT_568312 [Calocera viscosa TUFC12733]